MGGFLPDEPPLPTNLCEHLDTTKMGSATSLPFLQKGGNSPFHHTHCAGREAETRKGHQEMVTSGQLSIPSLPLHLASPGSAINSRKGFSEPRIKYKWQGGDPKI